MGPILSWLSVTVVLWRLNFSQVLVTKRSTEAPSEAAFGSTEYARIAEFDTARPNPPGLAARRVLLRFRRTAASGPGAGDEARADRIEGLELAKFYPPVTTQPDPAPLVIFKSRLVLTRPRLLSTQPTT